MRAKSINGASVLEIKTALHQSMADGFKPTVAIVFISIKQDRQAICELLDKQAIDILGATSSGEFINGHQSEGESVIMLLDIKRDYYRLMFREIGESTVAAVVEEMAESALKQFVKPAFILCSTLLTVDGRILQGETLIRSFEKVMGPEVSLYGGMAGDDITFTGTYVFTNDQSTDYGIVALVLDEDKLNLWGMAISGWKAMGVSRVITKSEDNLIYTIDDQPALEIYLRLLGMNISGTDDHVKFFDSIGVHYPFQIERENRDPMMCNPIGYDRDKKAVICESNVPQGSKFRFSTPPDFDIIETVVLKATDLKNETNSEAEALLIFSCASRLNVLGPMAHEENEGLYGVWKAPMAGFYTYGEFGKASNGKHELHSTTCCWVALKEK
jgi:hypothetical protein